MNNQMNRKIRLAELSDTAAVTALLNEVTIHLHNKGIKQWHYPWSYEEIKAEVLKKRVYLLTSNESLIATFSIKNIEVMGLPAAVPRGKYLYRIAIRPRYQGKKLGLSIINYACSYAEGLQCKLYLDCWAGNKKLRSFYTEAGFTHLGDFPEEDYFISVFKYEVA